MRYRIAVLCALVVTGVSSAGGVALASNGAAGWGGNAMGQLGTGNSSPSSSPLVVSGLGETSAIAAGGYHTMALLAGGTVEAWGDDSFGELGNGSTVGGLVPVPVSGLSEVVAIAAGEEGFSLALLANGTVKAWGNNEYGQLGDGTRINRDEPVTVSGLTGVVAIAAGRRSSVALLENGTVETWGANTRGQLGTGSASGPEVCYLNEYVHRACSLTPVPVTGVTEAIGIAAGGDFSLVLLSSHQVEAWGENTYGQLGDGTREGPEACAGGWEETRTCSATPVAVSGLTEVASLAAGSDHSLALIKGGTVKAWGDNESGQLGDGSTETRTSPVPISSLSSITAIAAGGLHSAARTSFGTVETWGDNGHGALGVSGKSHSTTPIGVPELSGVTSIAAGAEDTFAAGPAGPVVVSLSSSSGPTGGGSEITITGARFGGATKVSFGGKAAASFTVSSETTISAVSPPAKPGPVEVTVTSKHGTSDSGSAQEFTYLPEGVIELGTCKKVGSGKGAYKTGTCTEPLAGGAFQWTAGFLKGGFTDTGVSPKIETVGKVKLSCKGVTGHGSYQGTESESGVVLALTGCELGTSKCNSASAAEGEIVLSVLAGAFGWREKSTNTVGLLLAPAEEAEGVLTATCGLSTVRVRGAAIGAITPVNNMSASFTLKFKQSKGKQVPEAFEAESAEILEMSAGGGPYEQAGLTLEASQANEEELEINTVV